MIETIVDLKQATMVYMFYMFEIQDVRNIAKNDSTSMSCSLAILITVIVICGAGIITQIVARESRDETVNVV